MKLTQQQLTEIEDFIKKKGIKQIEVKNEILDHMACALEEKMSQNPTLIFAKAIQEVYASFGIFGFLEVEESIQKRIMQQVNSRLAKNMRQFFTSYRLIFPVLLITLGWQLADFVPEKDSKSWYALMIVLGVWNFITLFKVGQLYKEASVLLMAIRSKLYFSSNLFIYLFFLSRPLMDVNYYVFKGGFALILMFDVLFYWSSFQTYQWGKQEFRSNYQTNL